MAGVLLPGCSIKAGLPKVWISHFLRGLSHLVTKSELIVASVVLVALTWGGCWQGNDLGGKVPNRTCSASAPTPAPAPHEPPSPVVSIPSIPPPPEAPPWHPPVTDRQPGSMVAQKVVETLQTIEQTMKSTRYQHVTKVNQRQGIFNWDCSGMAAWILKRAAPGARRAMKQKRPLARDFYNVIARSPTEKARRGWRRLKSPEEIAPGDVYGWLKPPYWRNRKNTGHVGFVLSTPQPHPIHVNVWVMRISDATRILHEDDSRPPGGEGGFGTATMAFLFDDEGTPLGYGWYGAAQRPQTFVTTKIAFGRVTR